MPDPLTLSDLEEYLKPDFPKITQGDNGTTTELEYIGEASEIEGIAIVGASASPYAGIIKTVVSEVVEVSGLVNLRVTCEELFEAEEDTPGELREISYEIEWVKIGRPMLEHPQFRLGGGGDNGLEVSDVVNIEKWRNEKDEALKADFRFATDAPGYEETGQELSTNAKLFAVGILMGVEEWEDFAPVARKISRYVNGPPATTEAGEKDDPTGFPNLPEGYEWRKSADRSIRAGGQRKWDKTEEWEGAETVLVDKNQVYWSAP
jgi:hypothetical protein